MDNNNNFFSQDNSNNDEDPFKKPEPTGYDSMTGQPIYGQPQQEQQNQQQSQQQNQQQYQQQNQQQPYQQSPYQQNYQQQFYQHPLYTPYNNLEESVSFGDWMLTILISYIPLVNIVMAFVWAFGNGTKESKANYFKAYLAWILIKLAVIVVISVIVGASFISAISSMGGYRY